MACRRATWPTTISPSLVNPTTDGVMRLPSSFSITLGSRPSMMATTELVVPRSMPMVFFTCVSSPGAPWGAEPLRLCRAAAATVSTQQGVSTPGGAVSELRQGDRIGGRYVLLERLGLGGMGEVWLAELEGAGAFRRRVVIKMLAPERRGDKRIACMLADEARLVGLLHHPGIVAAIDYLESEAHGPIFVLEFVDGCLSRSGAVYLGDFGVARARGSEQLSDPEEGPKGKPGYMAPEQASGDPVGPQADIFSLGRVVAQAADVRCGSALRKVLDKATAPKAHHRFQTAAELAAALVHACPPPPDPDGALAEWLHRAAPEALQHRHAATGAAVVRSEAPPAGLPAEAAATSRGRAAGQPLFAKVAPPRRRALKIAAALGALLAIALPAVWLVHLSRAALSSGSRPAGFQAEAGDLRVSSRPAGFQAEAGDLRVSSRPAGGEVYVDGALRGTTPTTLRLAAGQHSVRVGNPRLGRWRNADVTMYPGSSGRLDFDLTE